MFSTCCLRQSASCAALILAAARAGISRFSRQPSARRPRLAAGLAVAAFGPALAQAEGPKYAEALAQAPIELMAFDVRGDHADSDYRSTTSSFATKTVWALQDTPQAISVVTAQQIGDQHMRSIEDVVRYVPGVSSHQGENNRDQLIFRGNSSSADFFLNGVRDDVQYYRDLYNLERVEVLRGPNAMIFGRGGGGGVINRVTKEAEFTGRREVTATVGAFGEKRAAVDFDQPLGSTFATRINVMGEESGSFRRFVDLRRYAVNPTITFRPSTEIKATLSYEHLHDARVADRGITSFQGRPVDVPIETYYGDPSAAHVRADVDLATATFDYTLGALSLKSRTLAAQYDRGYQNFVPGAVSTDRSAVALTAYNNATNRRNVFNQTDATWATDSGAIRHTLLGGVEVGQQLTDNFRNTGYFNGSSTAINVPYSNPVTAGPVTWRQSATDANNHLRATVVAAYAQDQIEFTREWQAILGLRFDSFALQYRNNRSGDELQRRDNLVSPRAGVVYKPTNLMSLYGSYSVSYLPSSGDQFSSLTTITQQVRPESFRNFELGAKFELRENVSLTTAIYRLDRTNTRATDPIDPTRIVQTGSQRSEGFEAGLSGTLRRGWTVSAGYAYQHAVIRSATTAARAGATVPQVPRQTASLWNKFDLNGHFAVGVGLTQRTESYAAIDNTVRLPGYTVVEAAAYYTFNAHWRAQLNVENLFNHRYYANADSNTNISPGSPLAVHATVTMRY